MQLHIVTNYLPACLSTQCTRDLHNILFAVFDERLVGPLQLQVSTGGLFSQPTRDAGKLTQWNGCSSLGGALPGWLANYTKRTILSFGRLSPLDGQHLLVVLHIKVHWILWHDVLHFEEEESACVDAARDPPRVHAILRLDGIEVRSRWVPSEKSACHLVLSPIA